MKKNKSIRDMLVDGELSKRQAITAIKNRLRRSLELRALKNEKKKNCNCCQISRNVMYRVQMDNTKTWIFICKSCLETLKPNNSNYKYGGTWKA